MSRKTDRNRPTPNPGTGQPEDGRPLNRRGFIIGIAIAVLVVVVAATVLYATRDSAAPGDASMAPSAALASTNSPTIGDPAARVHIVEFLDPACETCALFYPMVKQLIAQDPGRIRLSIRHVALHEGSDYVVRLLEASREQDRYWQVLETLLATQSQWTSHHTVQPDRVAPLLANTGLDMDRLMADMNSPEIIERVEQDRRDAIALKVTATPEYFVNGRPLPSFGQQQLLTLIDEELQRAY